MKNLFKNYNLFRGKTAFTLAETLITLGIVGIVAAITIPTLMKNYQEYVWRNSSQLFQRKLTEALKVMNTQGDIDGKNSTMNFTKDFAKYIKISKICDNNTLDCFTNNFKKTVFDFDNNTSSSENLSSDWFVNSLRAKWNNDVVGVNFLNGVSAIFIYNKNCKGNQFDNNFDGRGCLSGFFDINGNAAPNEIDKDIYAFGSIAGSTVLPMYKFNNKSWTAPFKPDGVSVDECVSLGIDRTFCTTIDNVSSTKGKNYWAGAVKTCGGINYLPTDADLVEFAKLIYPWDKMLTRAQRFGESGGNFALTEHAYCPDSKTCKNDEHLNSFLSLSSLSQGRFGLWQQEKTGSQIPYSRSYEYNRTSHSGSYYYYREYDYSTLGICSYE